MSQIIKHRRGSINNLNSIPARSGELIIGSGSISGLTGPFVFIGSPNSNDDNVTGAFNSVTRLYYGSTSPTINKNTYGTILDGVPFYSQTNKRLVILRNDVDGGNITLDLTGNIEGNTISGLTITNLTATTITASFITSSFIGNLTGVSTNAISSSYANTIFPYTGSGQITGSLAVTGNLIVSGSEILKNTPLTFNGNSPQITQSTNSFFYVSGSTPNTNDFYFTNYSGSLENTVKLSWLENNLYSGLLYGGRISIITGTTTYNVSAGYGLIVDLNASTGSEPYPIVKKVTWPNYTGLTPTYLTSSIQTFVGVDPNGQIFEQNTAFSNGQFNTLITLGTVLHQNKTNINASINYPSVAYGYKQRTYDFFKAFGPLKLSGLNIVTTGSLGLNVTSGTAWADGRNYQNNPNDPSYISDPGTAVSKIFRYYYVSGTTFVQDTNNSLGYTDLDPNNYVNNGVLTTVYGNNENQYYWTIQRVFWYPNSATKGIVVYYGNKEYASLTEAISNAQYETFIEVENTKQNAVYLGAIAIQKNATWAVSSSYTILPAGLFRNVGGSGGGGTIPTARFVDLSDVDIVSPNNGDLISFNNQTNLWEHGKLLKGNYTVSGSLNATSFTGSLSGTATNAVSSSYSLTSSFSISSSFANNSTSSSFSNNSVSSSYANTIFPYTGSGQITGSLAVTGSIIGDFTGSLSGTATNAVSSSFSTNAITASYSLNSVSASLAQNSISSSFANNSTSASFANNSVSSSYANTIFPYTGAAQITGSLAVTGSIIGNFTGSLSGTATNAISSSFSTNSISSSLAQNSISSSFANNSTSSSFANNSISASYALTASYAMNGGGTGVSFPYTGAAQITGSLAVTGSIIGDFTGSLSGTATNSVSSSFSANSISSSLAQNAISSSFSTNSTSASFANNIFPYTGSGQITGSLAVTGSIIGNFTGSLSGTATNSVSSSFSTNSISASFSNNSISSSFANNSISSSYALTASYAMNGGGVSFPYTGAAQITGSLAVTGSIIGNFTGSLSGTALNVFTNVITGSNSGTLSWDWSFSNNKRIITTTGNLTLSNPTGLASGEIAELVIAIGANNNTVSFDTAYRFPGFPSGQAPSFPSTSGSILVFRMTTDGTNVDTHWLNGPNVPLRKIITGSAYTFLSSDHGLTLEFSTACTASLSSSFFDGWNCNLLPMTTASMVIAVSNSLVVNTYPSGALRLAGQYAGASLLSRGSGQYVLVGQITT